jgi:hypothetical protein
MTCPPGFAPESLTVKNGAGFNQLIFACVVAG